MGSDPRRLHNHFDGPIGIEPSNLHFGGNMKCTLDPQVRGTQPSNHLRIRMRLSESLNPLVVLVIASLLIVLSSLACIPVLAQSATGQILGTVTDSTGAVIPNAAVTVTNSATNEFTKAKTNGAGAYFVSQLIPGPYTIKVEAPGFATTVVTVGALQVNQALNQIIALKAGSESQTVEVIASGEVMQTASAEIGVVVNPEQVHDIPLNGRNFTTLITLVPGAGPVSTAQSTSIGFGPISSVGLPGSSLAQPALQGQWNRMNFYTLDGAINSSAISSSYIVELSVGLPGSSLAQPALQGQWNRMNFYTLDGAINSSAISSSYIVLPMIDSIQEFKVQSHSDNAEFGGVLGGVVNVTTKPGGNAFHGAAWEYVRNSAFDANV